VNLCWLWLDHFPAGLELTEEQRREVDRRVRQHRLQDQNYRGSARVVARLAGVSMGVLSVLFVIWLFVIIRARMGVLYPVALLAGIMSFIGLIWLSTAWSIHRAKTPYVRKALCELQMPVCMDCGYILRGLGADATRCPECGAEREATVNREDQDPAMR